MNKQQPAPTTFNPNTQQRKKLSNFWPIFVLVCAILVIISIIIRLVVPPQTVQKDNTWLGITPGFSKEKDLYRLLGNPIAQVQQPYGKQLEYPSAYPTIPNKVITNANGDVILVQNLVDTEPPIYLDSYIKKFGQPDFQMYSEDLETAAPAYVFLSKGVVVLAHNQNGLVEQVWYFTPTSAVQFKQQWQELLVDELEPERYPADTTQIEDEPEQ